MLVNTTANMRRWSCLAGESGAFGTEKTADVYQIILIPSTDGSIECLIVTRVFEVENDNEDCEHTES